MSFFGWCTIFVWIKTIISSKLSLVRHFVFFWSSKFIFYLKKNKNRPGKPKKPKTYRKRALFRAVEQIAKVLSYKLFHQSIKQNNLGTIFQAWMIEVLPTSSLPSIWSDRIVLSFAWHTSPKSRKKHAFWKPWQGCLKQNVFF